MYVKETCICPFHYDLLFVPPLDSSVNSAWQHYYVLFPVLEMCITFLMSQMVES